MMHLHRLCGVATNQPARLCTAPTLRLSAGFPRHVCQHGCTRRFQHQRCNIHTEVQSRSKPFARNRILFFGTDGIACTTLQLLLKNLEGHHHDRVVDHIQLVCPANPPPSRGVQPHATRAFAMANHIHAHEPPAMLNCNDTDRTWMEWRQSLGAFDIGVVVSFGQMIPTQVIRSFRRGAINLHPSLLPRHRGAAPIINTILQGDDVAGISVLELSEGQFDKGRVFLQRQIDVDPKTVTRDVLQPQLAQLGAQAVLDVIRDFDRYNDDAVSQDSLPWQPCVSHKVRKEHGLIDFELHTADDIDRRFRAYGDLISIVTSHRGQRIRLTGLKPGPRDDIVMAQLTSLPVDKLPQQLGEFMLHNNALFVRCTDGWLEVTSLRPATKPNMDAANFIKKRVNPAPKSDPLRWKFSPVQA